MNKNIKAIALLSGGLDSILAAKIILEQGIELTGIHFALPFCGPDEKGRNASAVSAKELGIPFRMETMGIDYLDVIRNPKHGHGAGINPCIDCKIYMLKQAKIIADKEGAEFVITGEVLNQRPMSQHRIALDIIERDSGLHGKILRPLSAKFLPETIAEKNGLVDRSKLLSINGRSRKEQLSIAREKKIDYFTPAAGGCVLTDKFFTKKMKDLLEHQKDIVWDDILLLNMGRHFRYLESRVIVGRNEKENIRLSEMKRPGDYIFELPDEIPGPTTILQGEKTEKAIELSALLTLRYSDLVSDTAAVNYGEEFPDKQIKVDISCLNRIDYYNISSGDKG